MPCQRVEATRVAERLRTRIHEVDPEALTLRRARRLVAATVLVITLIGGVLGRLLDPHDFHSRGVAMWWSLQTVRWSPASASSR